MPVTELVINRPNWLRNIPKGGTSALLTEGDQKMCCLGFYSLACGFTEDQIKEVPQVDNLKTNWGLDIPTQMRWLVRDAYDISALSSSEEADKLMAANDHRNESDVDDQVRELTIAAIFARHGVTVTFTDEPLPA